MEDRLKLRVSPEPGAALKLFRRKRESGECGVCVGKEKKRVEGSYEWKVLVPLVFNTARNRGVVVVPKISHGLNLRPACNIGPTSMDLVRIGCIKVQLHNAKVQVYGPVEQVQVQGVLTAGTGLGEGWSGPLWDRIRVGQGLESILPEVPENSVAAKNAFQADSFILAQAPARGKERTEKEFEILAKCVGFDRFNKGRLNIPINSGAREMASILVTALLQALVLFWVDFFCFGTSQRT
ncbi:hypothetical protein POM88_011196 [Heracleum sosnowskyi]|uniref:Uncharacterized protein n=1 Tax=Heracleum sosnowskyi TaxID=360622 RepID=A0AAD8IXX6_9APIA|nr:hypothetical protein POM88_011196 [Heracleum sosnowskyi]